MNQRIQRNERGFGFFELYSGSHDHKRTRVWVHNSLIQGPNESPYASMREWVTLPSKGQVVRTDKGGLVLRSEEGFVFLAEVPSGYRGSASITSVEGGTIMAEGHAYHSGQGALGETAWALINAPGPIVVRGHRSGRRVDQGNIAFRMVGDGSTEELVEDEEVCSLLD